MVVLVTGGNGQLGQSIQYIAPKYAQIDFIFADSDTLDITNEKECFSFFEKHKPHYCINTAAYTAVDKAESEPEKAHNINVLGAKNLAQACLKHNSILLHISTDFVFDGTKNSPYQETDIPNPLGVYGKTKLDGEKAIQETFSNYYIIRTSWVYSQFANNFMKTMLRLAQERDSLSIVSDQVGTPTHAVDLAECLVKIIQNHNNNQLVHTNYGLYHFSNEGYCSWFDFAKKIFEVNNVTIAIQPIPSSAYPTPAKRPLYSVLDKTKIKKTFNLDIPNWEQSLKPL
jgi:dTDP-4-dehydrorhamnose reductase